MVINDFDIIKEAKSIFDKEIEALYKTRDAIDNNFEIILKKILECKGKVIITGMGKPGHIGTKMAASFASLGTPAFFMHPAEAMHGDLGMIEENDVVLLASYSGESTEVTKLLPVLQEIQCTTIAITGKPRSTLAKQCQYHFYFPEFEEACYMHLAPTSSTTALLVLGDALAVVASKVRNYTKEDFGLHHPAGALGKKLLVKVKDIMHSDSKNAIIEEGSTLRKAIIEMSSKGLSMVTIIDKNKYLKGIITDGDLRRMLEKGIDVYNEIVDHVMTPFPKYIDSREMAVNALQIMNDLKITCMPVLDENKKVIGSILMQDIYKAGIVR
ncbi:KpsF/GutQ family sugar-phosphate isomerase [Thomasclavelia cocleata]|jgi:arabinose-5-phosphate isomerase|uniref:KpsF/GutQ family sugar-phosphate isomerase n=1 Tax=Thomasclavelia cocleata TaxID=69824 RepID=UPI0024314661|nr:KpsF/GutQ family sugar-phosphate isomerase [Thomasclavelia cocleata]MCI9629982.1 KpsF/GutQ family sugar-phosphate isomerase [Thomasclavelia cocleata]